MAPRKGGDKLRHAPMEYEYVTVEGTVTFTPSEDGSTVGIVVHPEERAPFIVVFWQETMPEVVKGLVMATEAARADRGEIRQPTPLGLQKLFPDDALSHAEMAVAHDGAQLLVKIPVSDNLFVTQQLSVDDAERLADQIASLCRAARQRGPRRPS